MIEPFAGSAGYSRYWMPEKALLYDVDEYVVAVWDYLIHAKESEIRNLPALRKGQSVENLRGVPQEAKWLMGFWLSPGVTQPRLTVTAFNAWNNARARIADSLRYIRRWEVDLCPYDEIPDHRGTWFIDPPYQEHGKHYHYHDIDYKHLARWCRARDGQVIVCEAEGADWLPFRPVAESRGVRGDKTGGKRRTTEVAWIRS